MNEEALESTRRSFFVKVSVGFAAAVSLASAIPMVGFFFGPFLKKKPQRWEAVGEVSRFAIGKTVEVTLEDPSPLPWAGTVAKTGVWLRRETESEFVAFSMNCSHLGCPVRWMESADIFLCPCHGGVYYKDGRVAGGPPPRALTRFPIRIQNGQIEIQTAEIPIG